MSDSLTTTVERRKDFEIMSKTSNGKEKRQLRVQRVVMPVCYKQSSTDIIEWANAVRVQGRGKKTIIWLDDGCWNPADACFFTEAQCRHYHKLPPKDWQAVNLKVADRLEKMADAIRA